MTKDIKELLSDADINEEKVGVERSESMFLSYTIHGTQIHVELLTPNLSETLLKLPVKDQRNLISVLSYLVPQIGDHFLIVDDHGNGKKHRGARIIRIRSEQEGDINLLITR